MGLGVALGVGMKLERGVAVGLCRRPGVDRGRRTGDEVVLLQGIQGVTGGAEEDTRIRAAGVRGHRRLLLCCLDHLLVVGITGRHFWL